MKRLYLYTCKEILLNWNLMIVDTDFKIRILNITAL